MPCHVCVSRLEGTEEKLRNRESRPEDLHIIAELREMVTEREALVKKLVVSAADCGRNNVHRNPASCSNLISYFLNCGHRFCWPTS